MPSEPEQQARVGVLSLGDEKGLDGALESIAAEVFAQGDVKAVGFQYFGDFPRIVARSFQSLPIRVVISVDPDDQGVRPRI